MPVPDLDTVLAWRGRTVIDSTGEKIGKFEELYLDAQTDLPEWAGVSFGLVRRGHRLVPLSEATEAGDDLQVPFEKAHVESSPDVEAGGELSQEDEAALYRHYGLEYSREESATGLPPEAGAPKQSREAARQAPPGDAEEARSDEQTVASGDDEGAWEPVRIKKYVTTKPVTKDVPVEREEVVVEREVAPDDRDR